ncbi:type II toxin-antitoxin system VapC family toxin [Gracilimonas sp. BCB1]|uniref:type II toxin-antitoxin system VapC family toxin n=1 Tax=Gracilimonas sp. BCB1 TaxID=3152362 RepID=UPI0032D926C7
MIVVDTNVIASLWLPNGMEEIAEKVMRKDPEWIAPLLWKSEFRNVLALYFRKEIYDLPTILQIMDQAESLMTSNEFQVNSTQVLSLVKESTCSAYDCEFVALAEDAGVPLLTFDQKILSKFPSLAIRPESFV